MGLLCTERARLVTGVARRGWLVLGAISIGGTGIWVMHFVAMLGMNIHGAVIAYDVPITLASMVVAIVVVGVGLFIVHNGERRVGPLLIGGTFAGVGVAGMHYVGMAAMSIQGSVHYNPAIVALSVVIAVVAATAALWATRTVGGAKAIIAASLVMGLAVTGMHYTGIASMGVTMNPSMAMPSGLSASVLIPLLIIAVAVVAVMTALLLALSPGASELEEYEELSTWAKRQA
jgi:NO-binding membrane sensor protein with MHYT domain